MCRQERSPGEATWVGFANWPRKKGLFAVVGALCGWLLAGVGAVGCGGKSGGGGHNNVTVCENQEECPPGYDCVGNICVPEGDGQVEPDVARVPDIEVNPTLVDFGNPLLGVPVTQTVTISNVGTGDLTVTSIVLEEDDGVAEYSAQPTGTLNQVVTPGGSMDVEVELNNIDAHADTGRLLITSNDPDEPMIQVDLTSELKGDVVLATCVMESDTLFENCVKNPEVIDYGTMAYDATALKDVSVFNTGTGNRPLVLYDIYVSNGTGHGNLFTLTFYRFVEDPNNPGEYIEEELADFPAEPYLLNIDDGQGTPEALLVKAEFHAAVDGQAVPAEFLIIESDDDASPTYQIPFDGFVECPPGYWNLDGQPGCEYQCDITNNGVEECDGVDNDCNGQTDEGVNPGLCLVCDVNGQPVPGNDDAACGTIDCSGWYAKTGNTSPTGTDECYGHESITANRCEGGGDCKDPNTADCVGQPLLGTPQISCGVCLYVAGCDQTTAGTCDNYPDGTPTTLCVVCDGAGGERPAADDSGCGPIDCSGWYIRVGNSSPTDTDYCHGRQPITADRCEGAGDCKDPNTSDCDGQPAAAVPDTTCGICRRVVGCIGNLAGSCENYLPGTDTGLCRECDGNGAEQPAADDTNCGVIDCSGWYVKTGTQGPADTEQCFGHQDLTANRCEGMNDCKDPNTADCNGQPTLAVPSQTCGVCMYMVNCSGDQAGTCADYPSGTETGLCRECDGNGVEQPAADDANCGIIDCSGWYTKTGTQGPTDTEQCFGHQDLTANRCEGINDCKDANTSDCDPQPLLATPSATCGTCTYMTGCTGPTAGSCVNYSPGIDTGLCRECDGTGGEQAATDDNLCGTIECGGWYTKTGTQSPTDTENCFGHQDITANRCEGLGDCKDANTSDCDPQPLEGTASASCGVCKFMVGCSGVTAGSCTDYAPGTDTGLCRECDGSGGERASADDNLCGTIECGGWFTKQGTAGPATTEYCFGHQDIASNRCEGLGDCKDANTADCDGQLLEAAASVTCGTCKYMQGCTGTTLGTCANYAAGTDSGLCRQCDGNGGEQAVADDDACGAIECGGWYTKTGTAGTTTTEYCYGHQDITANRCEGLGDCKDPNSDDCSVQPTEATPSVTCGVCKYMQGCVGITAGTCDNYPSGMLTSGTCSTGACLAFNQCDGNGNEVCNPGSQTGDDSDCDNVDDDCDGQTDEHAGTTTCGLGVCNHTIQNCIAGVPQVCDPYEGQSTEICDGLDNDCDGETDELVQTDPLNCGSCGNVCSNPNGSTACIGGSCVPTCDPGWGVCGGDPDEGCQVPLNTLTNCGACGVPCNDGSACTADSCSTGVCSSTPYCSGTNTSCGCTTCTDCTLSDGWYNVSSPYACCSGSSACTCQDQEYRSYTCNGTTCGYAVTGTRRVESGCTSCNDGSSCTADTCSGGTCSNVPYCSGTGTSCGCTTCTDCTLNNGWYNVSSTYPCCSGLSSCTCQDQEYRSYTCNGTACGYAVTNTRTVESGCTSCSDGSSCTADSCSGGTCSNVPYCAGTNTNCGCTTCTNCTLSNGWYNVSSPYACCDGLSACTCQNQEYRSYTCSGTTCGYAVTSTRTVESGCTSCNDGSSCTVDSCSGGTCSNVPYCSGTNTSCGCTSCTNCTALPNVSSTSCSGTSCVINSCVSYWGNYDGNVSNGCECNGTSYEYNNYPNYYNLGTFSDCDYTRSVWSNLVPATDDDFFIIYKEDDLFCVWEPKVRLRNIPAGTDYDLYFYTWNGSSWDLRASSTAGGNTAEYLNLSGYGTGWWGFRIVRFSGTSCSNYELYHCDGGC